MIQLIDNNTTAKFEIDYDKTDHVKIKITENSQVATFELDEHYLALLITEFEILKKNIIEYNKTTLIP